MEGSKEKPTPDAAAMAASAATIDDLAKDLPNWFAWAAALNGVKTHAKAEVWTDTPGFADKARALREK